MIINRLVLYVFKNRTYLWEYLFLMALSLSSGGAESILWSFLTTGARSDVWYPEWNCRMGLCSTRWTISKQNMSPCLSPIHLQFSICYINIIISKLIQESAQEQNGITKHPLVTAAATITHIYMEKLFAFKLKRGGLFSPNRAGLKIQPSQTVAAVQLNCFTNILQQ